MRAEMKMSTYRLCQVINMEASLLIYTKISKNASKNHSQHNWKLILKMKLLFNFWEVEWFFLRFSQCLHISWYKVYQCSSILSWQKSWLFFYYSNGLLNNSFVNNNILRFFWQFFFSHCRKTMTTYKTIEQS